MKNDTSDSPFERAERAAIEPIDPLDDWDTWPTVVSICDHEGFRATCYRDSRANWTIGHGIHVISEEESRAVVEMRVESLSRQIVSTYGPLHHDVLSILVEMAYQLGFAGMAKFEDMFAALDDYEYRAAGAAMRDSRWFAQTPNRCETLAARMEAVADLADY